MMLYGFEFEDSKPLEGQVCELNFDNGKIILKSNKNKHLNLKKKMYVSHLSDLENYIIKK